jgi:hemerythrin-like domain-containing protein
MATRTSSKARNEVLDMLREDHKKAKKAFTEFERLDKDDEEDAERCNQIIEQTCKELEVHATLEEEVFYPAVREAIREPDLVDEAEVEHMTAKMLIGQLQEGQLDEEKQTATFTVLGEYIKHHIREEENEMFEMLERTKIDWDGLQQQMQQRRAELMQEKGLADESAIEEEADAGGSRGRSRRRTRETETTE